MMRNRHSHHYGSPLAFIDMLLNIVIAMSVLFMISYLTAKKVDEPVKKGMDMKAEFVISLEWPGSSGDDIDLHLLLPSGKKVWYRNKDVGYATLERDDQGSRTDFYVDADGNTIAVPSNKEIITIRAV